QRGLEDRGARLQALLLRPCPGARGACGGLRRAGGVVGGRENLRDSRHGVFLNKGTNGRSILQKSSRFAPESFGVSRVFVLRRTRVYPNRCGHSSSSPSQFPRSVSRAARSRRGRRARAPSMSCDTGCVGATRSAGGASVGTYSVWNQRSR